MKYQDMNDQEFFSQQELRRTNMLQDLMELRQHNFDKNLPFMILSAGLPAGQCYREYADGRMEVQELDLSAGDAETKLVRMLDVEEADAVRKAYGL